MAEEKLSIKVLVDGKTQKLDIHRDAEEIVREAAKRLNSTLFEYRRDLKLDDAGDYLRLAALQYAVMAVESEYQDKISTVTRDLKSMEGRLEDYLSEQAEK